jgi:tetratricopeptide (TPR) repeat protein
MPFEIQQKMEALGGKSQWMGLDVLGVVCALVIGGYAYMAQSGALELLSPNAADNHYNLLVQGFRVGQLSLEEEIPAGLARLPDPYDPTANVPYRLMPYRLHDLSYYRGRLYLYFGVTPALILFWPFAALTGHYLSHREAVVVFCAIGFLASVGALYALWRRYFSEVSIWVVAACALALGLTTGMPVMLPRSSVYEVAISCGYMLMMLALGAIWRALHEPERSLRWLVVASVAYGLAVGARPSLLFGAVILLVPVVYLWRERQPIWTVLMAATIPITLIGLGLMLYNALRFDSPFEFGMRYQLATQRQVTQRFFSLRYLWFNFRVYFLEPVRWSSHFPFVREIAAPPLPTGHGEVETPFGVLTNVPAVWLALALPLAWRDRTAAARSTLRGFLSAVALIFGIYALVICLFSGANCRYEVEFLPALLLLAVGGILGLERALADRPALRRATRWVWGLLLSVSVAFNLLAGVGHRAAAHENLGEVLARTGRIQEAIGQYEQALRIKPDYSYAHYNLGIALGQVGKTEDAIEHYEQALQINPDYAEAHHNLGVALMQSGRMPEAIKHLEYAVQVKPDFAEAQSNLGIALCQAGRIREAIGHFEQALRLQPDSPELHGNLGLALELAGKTGEAIGHYERALRLKPDCAQAQKGLARLRAAP